MNARSAAVGLGVVAIVGLCGYWLYGYVSSPVKASKPRMQQIAVLRQQPPPPPPKPEVKPPEPQIKKEEVKLPDPEPDPQQAKDEPPPAQDLGVDAQGTAGSDGFGLQGRPGGRDITTIGETGNGTGKVRFAMFTQMVQGYLQEELSKRRELRAADYRVTLRLWFSADGRIDRAELAGTAGTPELDASLRTALASLPALREAPPPDLPQPVRLRITSRGAG